MGAPALAFPFNPVQKSVDGTPNFGSPMATEADLAVPSGEGGPAPAPSR